MDYMRKKGIVVGNIRHDMVSKAIPTLVGETGVGGVNGIGVKGSGLDR